MSSVSIRSIRRLLNDTIAAQAKREAEAAEMEADRIARAAEMEADRVARAAEMEADRVARAAEMEAMATKREAERVARAAEMEAKAAKREAERVARAVEMEAERVAKTAEREAERETKIADWKAEMMAAREAEAAERRAWVAEQERLLAISKKEADEGFKQMRQELGSHGASHGEFVESLFVNLGDKFNSKFGFHFPKEARGVVAFLDENRRVIAEVDRLLENGDAVLAVEVKAKLRLDDVDDHLKRLGVVYEYNKKHNDNRRVLGAIAGGVVKDSILNYAHKKGLYVLVLNGENVSIADLPPNFKPHVLPANNQSDLYEVSTS